MPKYLVTTKNGTTTVLNDHFALRDEMSRRGMHYSELTDHVADVDHGHVITAEDGTDFELYKSAPTDHREATTDGDS